MLQRRSDDLDLPGVPGLIESSPVSSREETDCPMIYINTRVLGTHLTGVQRYTRELLVRLSAGLSPIAPPQPRHGVQGHAWEQLLLPWLVGRNVLFSPSNTGPFFVKKQVLTLHDAVALDHPEWQNPRFAAWYRFLIPKLARRVAHVITVSKFSKERLLAHIPMEASRITVIPIGVDPRFRPLDRSEAEAGLVNLNLPSSRYVLFVGSHEPRKNLNRLMQAWARIVEKIPPDVWLVAAGQEGDRRIFSRDPGLASLPRRVYFTGHVDDGVLPCLYAGALAFVFPSLYEGFGLPPLEAMACGVPVLTGNQTSLPEVVGDAGLMVDPYDVNAIAEGLKRLIGDPGLRDRLRNTGPVRAGRFDWNVTAERTREVLEAVAAGRYL
jgi:glycosyltransferase involved in cell wall biosynthesis